MTAEEYMASRVSEEPTCIRFGGDDKRYCKACWNESKLVEEVIFDPARNGRACRQGHFEPNRPLASGGWA